MAIWNVQFGEGVVSFGSKSRKALTESGCNEPFKNCFWCPKKRWFSKGPCPFESKAECENFQRWCGAL